MRKPRRITGAETSGVKDAGYQYRIGDRFFPSFRDVLDAEPDVREIQMVALHVGAHEGAHHWEPLQHLLTWRFIGPPDRGGWVADVPTPTEVARGQADREFSAADIASLLEGL